jgi:hypothetical protein
VSVVRTWELSHDGHYDLARALWKDEGWPNDLQDGPPLRVIELDPVLLEGWLAPGGESDWSALTLEVETEALLTAHGRLRESL